MLAAERLIEIEMLCTGKVQRIELLELDGELIKVILYFKDGTNLRVTELWNDNLLVKYSYYWLTPKNEIKAGWDNAPHHQHVKTFPHHKHIQYQKDIKPSKQHSLEDVIAFIFGI
ncbi:MAG: hypothetical protein JRG68_06410 [Deltaproteobacteria bacterium]|nr:hypothetical protein [Deltaproteobacteria bacterium]MBW2100383.1 hypothetical protein [Deltaproteobacteria bacterium]